MIGSPRKFKPNYDFLKQSSSSLGHQKLHWKIMYLDSWSTTGKFLDQTSKWENYTSVQIT